MFRLNPTYLRLSHDAGVFDEVHGFHLMYVQVRLRIHCWKTFKVCMTILNIKCIAPTHKMAKHIQTIRL